MTTKSQSRLLWCFLVCSMGLGMMSSVKAQSPYTWNTTGTANWSTTTDWTPTAPTSGPGVTDTANISNLSLATTVNYDTGASGKIGTLNMVQNTTNVNTTLKLAQNLEVGSLLNLNVSNAVQTTASVLADEYVNLNGFTLTVDSGAKLLIGSETSTVVPTEIWLGGATTTTVSGTVAVNGTLEFANAQTTGATATVNSAVSLGSTSTLEIDSVNSAASRLVIGGNFSAATGSTIETLNHNATLYLQGLTNSIGGGTLTGFSSGAITFADSTASSTQTNSIGIVAAYIFRDLAAGSMSTQSTLTQTYTATNAGNSVDQIGLQGGTYATQTFQLGSNLVLKSGQYSPIYFNNGATSVSNVDLNGDEFDATGSTTGFTPSSSATSIAAVTAGSKLNIINSGTSSISGNNGLINAAYYNLINGDMGIGTGVTLQASGAGGTNNLGQISGGTTAINAGSNFYYTGVGTQSTLTSSRAIGGLIVGNGSAISTLQLASNITTGGSSTVASTSILDLNGKNLTVGTGSGSPLLSGTGTVKNTSGTTASTIAFASGARLNVTGGTSATGTMNINTGTLGVTLNLTNAGLTANLNSGNASDLVAFSSNVSTLTFSSNTINFNDLTSGNTLSTGLYTIFSVTSGTSSNFTSTGNLTLGGADADGGNFITGGLTIGSGLAYYQAHGDTVGLELNNVGGNELLQLNVSAVPEPDTVVMLLGGVLMLVALGRMRRNSVLS